MRGFDLNEIASAVYSACLVDLPPIEYQSMDFSTRKKTGEIKYRRPQPYEVEVVSFPQTWGSTALGFGGMGGASMTTAQTVIVSYGNNYCVYFAGRFAYMVSNRNEAFFEDIKRQWMVAVRESGKYSNKEEDTNAED